MKKIKQMTYIVYHVRNGVVNIMSYSHQNTGGKPSTNKILRELCEWKEVYILEAEACL